MRLPQVAMKDHFQGTEKVKTSREQSPAKERTMCLTLTFKVFGATLFFQGCIEVEQKSLPQKVDPPTPPITTEDWAPMVAKADVDDDGSITYFFRDTAGRVRPAVAACGETMPKEEDGKVMITQIRHKKLTVYTVSCTQPPKIM